MSPREKELCLRVREYAVEYWKTSPNTRSLTFGWLDEHALKCDDCALFLENAAEEALRKSKRNANG